MSSKDGKRRIVPKFGSFKPKPVAESKSEPELEPEARATSKEASSTSKDHSSRDTREDFERRSRHRDDRHRADRHQDDREHKHTRHEPRAGAFTERPRDSRPVAAASGPTPSDDNDLFFFDTRGDPLILRYGNNDRSRVPSYRRIGGGRVMGSNGRLEILQDGPRQVFIIRDREGGVSGSAFRDKKAILASRSRPPRRIKSLPNPNLPTCFDDYVPLESEPCRKRRKLGEEEERDRPPDYRSIEGRNAKVSDSDSDESGSDSDTVDEGVEMTATKTRSIGLSQKVRDHPEDVDSWLELIRLQDALLRENTELEDADPHRFRSAEEAKGLAELKLSMYEKALSHSTSASDKERLTEEMMREGARVWDPKTLRRKWAEVARTYPRSFALWKSRLNYELTDMTAFTHEDVKRFITDKLHSLAETLRAGASVEVCRQVVYVFLRLTRFLFDAGYSELAVAAWQAILELTFSRPTTEEYTDAQSAMSSFADFWESEVPRIGEDGAKGWRHFVDEGMSDAPDPEINTKTTLPETRDQFKAWALMERQAMESACMPARTLDDDGQDDPFRVVMFSDIKDFLVWFPSSALSIVENQLLDAYVLFCRLPTASLSCRVSSSAWSNDPFITPTGKPIAYRQRLGSEIVAEKKTPDFGQTYGGNVALSQELLFNSGNWFRVLDKWTTMFRADDPQVPLLSWVLHTLRFLVCECKVEAMAEYYLALDWLNSNSNSNDPATAKKKTAKALLKQYSSNLRLYNAYALMEFASGNIDMAIKVLSSATSLPSDSGRQQLWNTWTWIHLESNQPQLALVRLCSSVDASVTTITSAVLLKVRSRFGTVRDYSLSSMQLETAVEYAESLALLDYLTSSSSSSETGTENGPQGCIGAAMERILQVSGEFQSRKDLAKSEHHERLLQVAARLLYFHATHGSYRPAYLRAQFRSFVTLFPQNSMFLELYSWSEATTLRVDEPVRSTLEAISLKEPYDCVAVRRFAIAHEATTTHGTVHSTKAAFESAVGSDVCEGNVGLWVEYVRFCAHQIQMQKGRDGKKEKRDDKVAKMARDVYYRALAACPWSKQLYLEGFRDPLVRECGSAELRAVYHTFAVAKGLRVHVDLSDL